MTIASVPSPRVVFSGDGVTTAFPVGATLAVYTATDLRVVLVADQGVQSNQVLSTDYVVNGLSGATPPVLSSATINMTVAPPSGYELVVTRFPLDEQPSDFRNLEPLNAETLERGLDQIAMRHQGLSERISRGLRLPANWTYGEVAVPAFTTGDAGMFLSPSATVAGEVEWRTPPGTVEVVGSLPAYGASEVGSALKVVDLGGGAQGTSWVASVDAAAFTTAQGDIAANAAAIVVTDAGLTALTAQVDGLVVGEMDDVDTDTTAPVAGDALIYDGSNFVPEGVFNGTELVILQHQESSGIAAGNATAGAWYAMELDTIAFDGSTSSWFSLDTGTGVVTLEPGTYRFQASNSFYYTHFTRMRLRDTGASADLGVSGYIHAQQYGDMQLSFEGEFTLAAQTTVRLEYRCSRTQGTNGRGRQSSFGVNEIYETLSLTRIA